MRLSRQESRTLDEIGRGICSDDPPFAARCARRGRSSAVRRRPSSWAQRKLLEGLAPKPAPDAGA